MTHSEHSPNDAFLEGLNPTQLDAVNTLEGPVLVIAGAGSGKTRTLVYRVAKLIANGVDPKSILLLTFTRKSAQDMLRRAEAVMDRRCQAVSGGTFHAFANAVLRRYARLLGYSEQFTILDRSDAEDLISQIRTDLGLGKLDKRFPKKNVINSIFNAWVNTEKTLEEVVAADYPQFLQWVPDLVQIAGQYTQLKQRMNVMDYDDLLYHLARLLRDFPDVARQLSETYRYIMIDEYQDTNALQAEILVHLAASHHNVLAVGDDAQSIYSFRGATIENIFRFPKLFAGTKIIKLEQNYRSTQPILDLTNAVIARAENQYEKQLFTENSGRAKPVFVETMTENEQSRFVVKEILKLREQGVPLEEMAVLVRSGFHSNDLEVELKASDIPFIKVGGFKFVESSHVKDMVAYLRVLGNRLDMLSWQRVLTLIEGLGPRGAQSVAETAAAASGRLMDANWSAYGGKAYWKDIAQLLAVMDRLTSQKWPVSYLVDEIMSYYEPLFKTKYDDYVKRQADLNSLKTIAGRYTDLDQFLSEMSLEPPDNTQFDVAFEQTDERPITVSTIHSAKGLEWNTVFILSVVDGYIPSFQSLNDPKGIEEERRLLYVALTRAKKRLYVLKPHIEMNYGGAYRYSGMGFSKVSRFLEEPMLRKLTETQVISDGQDATQRWGKYRDTRMYGF